MLRLKRIAWIELASYINTPLKIMLVSISISTILSALITYFLTGEFIVGAVIGSVVSAIVSYPVGKIILTQINKIRNQNKELERLNQALETYNRILAHEIKNKISIISLSSQLMTRTMQPDDKAYRHATNVSKSSIELIKLINNLLSKQTHIEDDKFSQSA